MRISDWSSYVCSSDLLEPGPRDLPLTLYIVSTGGYRVSVASENQGRLKLVGAPWFIDYQLRLGRHDIDLRSPDSFEVVSSHARLDNYPVKIEIGETADKRAGRDRKSTRLNSSH